MSTIALRHVAAIVGGGVDKKTRDNEFPVRLCNYTDVYKNDEVRPNDGLMRATATAAEIARFRLRAGDTVITKDSEDPNDIGVAAFIPESAADFVCGYHLAIVRPSDAIDSKFLYWSLRSKGTLAHFSIGANGMTRYGLDLATIRSVPIPVTPVDDQRRIADFLSDWVSRIDNAATARRHQLELEAEAFSAELDTRTSPPLDQYWPIRKFSHLARVNAGVVDPRHDPFAEMSLIAPNHIEKGTGRLLELKSAREQGARSGKGLVRKGQLIYSKIRPALRKATIAPTDCLCSADMYAMSASRTVIDEHYLLLVTLSKRFTDQAVDVSERVAIPKLNREALAGFRLRVPSPAEQSLIVDQLRSARARLDRLQEARERSIALLGEYRQSLITAAVAGELDVTTASPPAP